MNNPVYCDCVSVALVIWNAKLNCHIYSYLFCVYDSNITFFMLSHKRRDFVKENY
jgi:hypothetical protein